jgi:hypothetical protein
MVVATSSLTEQQVDYLLKLLDKRYTELLHELHHAATNEYKAGLKREIELTEKLKVALAAEASD